ncbi:hypothetical protein GCM10010320_03540 [Streptomyces caelestis]|uniref:CcbQ n=1 Tax=Streptomyces caelestis TaxID=36816 RepID=E9JET5_9ACTN|nr:CcbQ [Streptomyces caelestis]GGW28021.1 hypothetical protein GCM10010320_03540 [Streptomyces caelestis]
MNAASADVRTLRHVRSATLRFADSALTSHVEHDVVEYAERSAGSERTRYRVVGSQECLKEAGQLAEECADVVAAASRIGTRERMGLLRELASLGPGIYGRVEDVYGATATVDDRERTGMGTMARRNVIVTTVRDGVRRTRAVSGSPDELDVRGLALAGKPLPQHEGPLPTQVVLEPLALAELLAEYASVGLAVQDPHTAREFHRRCMGQQVAAAGVDITDTPAALGGWTLDIEGTPAAPLSLLRDGRITGYATDHRGAAALGQISNGRAARSVDGLRAYPAALTLECPPTTAPIGPYLRIERVQYISVVSAETGTVTGSTRDYCSVVENGAPRANVGTVRFTISVPDLLRRITGGLGPARTVPVTWGGCVVRCPAVHCADLRLVP